MAPHRQLLIKLLNWKELFSNFAPKPTGPCLVWYKKICNKSNGLIDRYYITIEVEGCLCVGWGSCPFSDDASVIFFGLDRIMAIHHSPPYG